MKEICLGSLHRPEATDDEVTEGLPRRKVCFRLTIQDCMFMQSFFYTLMLAYAAILKGSIFKIVTRKFA